ncbi:MAG TPA: aspartate aminotransferase family protein, partial [Vicinamibacteria bacterium]|nr:aspartate aminotransferase family protein [Vicinamibacteria bacterium]
GERFLATHPRSHALFERAKASLLGGVPMSWMVRWAGGFPIFATGGEGAHFEDVDGHRYLDLCLGDTGAMTGHAPAATVRAATERLARGVTFMLPTEDAVIVGEELQRRFGLPSWQITLSATDANRFALRLARGITGRSRVLVFNYCYHGTVDEAFATLTDGRVAARPDNLGPAADPAATTRVVEWNDVEALEEALRPGDVACVLAEPAMTNVGIIHPEPGYHRALREITRRTGTLLLIDETHTICTGPGGYTREHGLEPDLFVIGKLVAGGIPAAAYGLSAAVAERVARVGAAVDSDTNGIGGTLAGNALSLAAMRATLTEVLTPEFYARAIPLAERFTAGVLEVIAEKQLPWIVKRLGCRAEYWFRATPPRNGGEAAAAVDAELDQYMHLAALNRGILMTPFHNMALFCPAVTDADVDRHTEVFRESVAALLD